MSVTNVTDALEYQDFINSFIEDKIFNVFLNVCSICISHFFGQLAKDFGVTLQEKFL